MSQISTIADVDAWARDARGHAASYELACAGHMLRVELTPNALWPAHGGRMWLDGQELPHEQLAWKAIDQAAARLVALLGRLPQPAGRFARKYGEYHDERDPLFGM